MFMKKSLIAAAIFAIAAIAVPTEADAQRRGNVVSNYDPGAPRHGMNVVTGTQGGATQSPGGKRRTLNSGWCDVNGCSMP